MAFLVVCDLAISVKRFEIARAPEMIDHSPLNTAIPTANLDRHEICRREFIQWHKDALLR
jgi:hypothetical protein